MAYTTTTKLALAQLIIVALNFKNFMDKTRQKNINNHNNELDWGVQNHKFMNTPLVSAIQMALLLPHSRRVNILHTDTPRIHR